MRSILLCDERPRSVHLLVTALTAAGYSVQCAMTGAEAITRSVAEPIDVLVTDLCLPDMSGLDVLSRIRAKESRIDVVVMAGGPSVDTAVEAMRLGACDYLVKPVSVEELLLRLGRLFSGRALREQNVLLQEQRDNVDRADRLMGTSACMRETFELLSHVASTDATVLFLGESGTGKTMLARALHAQSRRRNGPFCEIHCAALPESLLQSELFGHERGAFTGAAELRIGHVERADKGTLFLDEIGDLPSAIQVKLLRFLQERRFFRVGGTEVRSVDVRLICATSSDMEQAMREGGLRDDFFYRINVFPIHVPPLRERSQDIPVLVGAILQHRFRHRVISVADDLMELLCRYPWPGNIRELENVLERAVILAGGTKPADRCELQLAHVPHRLMEQARPVVPATLLRPGFSIDRMERELVREALVQAADNKSKAAKLLGISRRRLYSRIKRMEDETSDEAAP